MNKERHVEQSIEKVRRSLGETWKNFSPGEIELLKYIFGEAWVSMERRDWAACSFTMLTEKDVKEIIEIGKRVKQKDIMENTGIGEVDQILRKYM